MASPAPRANRPRAAPAWILFLLLAVSATAAVGQPTDNECDAGESPDVIVGDIHQHMRWGEVGGITAFSIGTVSCNQGTCGLDWQNFSNLHPVIGQNMFRLENGRFEQIGQAWLKHGFNALSQELCSTGCIATSGTRLGVNCSDPYRADTNGVQHRLGPKFEVNPTTGSHPHPVTDMSLTGNTIYKRLQVKNIDIDPALHPAALFFVEGHYVTEDDAAAGNDLNNASYRPIDIIDMGGSFDIQLTGQTQREQPAISAWAANDTGVTQVNVDVAGDGRFIMAAKATDIGGGVWHYEYAIQNLNSERAARSFSVPIPFQFSPTNIGFHDADYHSNEPFAGTDWTSQVNASDLSWSTEEITTDPDANALRWGTLYNFRFDLAAPPVAGEVTLGLFKPGSPTAVTATTIIPDLCDEDATCEPLEECTNCLADCPDTGPNVDGDAFVSCSDCNDNDSSIWSTPSEATSLLFNGNTSLEWSAPASPGGNVVSYETLRSGDPSDFVAATTCVADPDPLDTMLTDVAVPVSGAAFHYLVRGANTCPGGDGTLGDDSSGAPRAGASCP